MNTERKATGFEIAVIGMSGGFPQAPNINVFWDNLKNGIESITFLTDEELEQSGISQAQLQHPNYVNSKGAQFEEKKYFDAFFFGYTPAEAEVMDPHFRIFHEYCYHALENAGYDAKSYPGKIGLYAGSSFRVHWNGKVLFSGKSNQLGGFSADQLNDKNFLTTWISYKLNLKGPSVVVQSACSTSLVAIHLACRALLMAECDVAMAGGVSVMVEDPKGYIYQEGMILSPDGHCRAFDAHAAGTAGGEGVGVVVLKRLKHAIEHGDTIHAVILGSAINNDGNRKAGYSAPSIDGQIEVIRLAQHVAKVEQESIRYVEAHGTGTIIGDPIEIEALNQAFNTPQKTYCAIGSVKTNIGHLDAAAGVAGFIKAVLVLKNGQIPPSINFETPNPRIDFDNTPFYVNTVLTELNNHQYPLRAAVSSLGIGGTNAHIILEEPPPVENSSNSRAWQMIVLSAKTETALHRATINLSDHLKTNPGIDLANVAYTLQVGRTGWQYRKVLVCSTTDEAIEALSSPDSEKVKIYHSIAEKRPIVFMFSGQGSQYVDMGLDLYQNEPLLREEIDACFNILREKVGYDFINDLYPSDGKKGEGDLNQTSITQPILFVFEYALAKFLIKWGISPSAMIGHSIGEYVAACLAGVFAIEDALMLVAYRGELMQQMPSGSMVGIPLSEDELKPFLMPEISLAAVNSDSNCVVSGPHEDINSFMGRIEANGKEGRLLHTSHAFHSHMMDPILDKFTQKVKQLTLNKPAIPYISNVSGTWIRDEEATDPTYWATHLRCTVRFSAGIKELVTIKSAVFLEIGPGRTLSTSVTQHKEKTADQFILNLIKHPKETESDNHYFLNQIARLWLYGITPDWKIFYQAEKRRRIPLPSYSFDHNRFWIDGDPFEIAAKLLAGTQAAQKVDISQWFYIPVFENSLLLPPEKIDTQQSSCWLVFLDLCGLGESLVKRLEQKGCDVITVSQGTETKLGKKGSNQYVIDPKDSHAYDALFRELHEKGNVPRTIAHLWGVTAIDTGNSGVNKIDVDNFEKIQDLGFYSLFYMTQAIGNQKIIEKIQIGVVTNHGHDVTGDNLISPAKSTIYGALKVIPQEYPNIKCCTIDVVIPESLNSWEEKLIDQLLKEFYKEFCGSTIAYRHNKRFEQRLVPIELKPYLESQGKLRKEGIYMITGGLGNVGLMFAEYLAREVNARLILIGRSPFLPRMQWDHWIANHDKEDSISYKINKIKELEDLGAKILILVADVSHKEQMQQVFEEAEKQYGKINGVIHAAGELSPQTIKTIAEMDKTCCSRQFNPKVHGLIVLDNLLEERELDFCVLTSSLSSILGGLGFIAYAAANSFMDAYAQSHNKRSRVPWISVNWDGWRSIREPQNSNAITMKEGGTALHRIIACEDSHQIVVSVKNIYPRIEEWVRLIKLQQPKVDNIQKDNSNNYQQRSHLSSPYVPPSTREEQIMADIWQNFFGIQQVGIQDSFFELGGDSLKAIQLINLLNNSNIRLTVDKIFLLQTIGKICHSISQKEDSSLTPDYRTIENYVFENYGIKAYYKNYQIGNAPYRVLYLISEEKDAGKLLENQKENFRDLYPNFIKLIKSSAEVMMEEEIAPEVFSSMMGFSDRVNTAEDILEEFNKNSHFSHLLKKNNMTRKYQISSCQKAFLQIDKNIGENNISFLYDFTFPIQLQEIEKIIIKIVNENCLLRSIIVKTDDDYYIQEFNSFSNIQLPLLDISNYSFDCKKEIQETLFQNLEKPFEVVDTVLYRAIIIKLDNSHSKLIFKFNHLIFDGESTLSLTEQIDACKGGWDNPPGLTKNVDYYDYVTFLHHLNYENVLLENYLNIPDFLESVINVYRTNKGNFFIDDLWKMDISILNSNSKDIYNEILLLSYAKLIRDLFGIDNVPILFYSYGRNYKDANFNNIIGDFHDLIPFLLPLDGNRATNLKKLVENFQNYRGYVRSSNLNFTNFILKKYEAGGDYLKMLTSPFTFNSHLGLYDRFEYIFSQKISNPLRRERVGGGQFRFQMETVKDLYSDNIFIRIMHNSIYEDHGIRELFIKNFMEVAEYFNGTESDTASNID